MPDPLGAYGMTLEQSDVVDFVGIESVSGDFVLTLTDAWGWSPTEEQEHLLLLQAKLNSYIAAIESGEIYESYAQRVGRSLAASPRTRIEVRLLNAPSPRGREFLRAAKAVLVEIGVDFAVVEGPAKLHVS